MRISASARYAFVMSAASGMLAGCSGGSQEGGSPTLSNSQRQQSASTIFSPRNGKGMTYIAPIGTTTVYGYERDNRTNQPAVCTLGPLFRQQRHRSRRSGNLWVPDMGANPKTVSEYGPDCGAAKTVLPDSGDVGPDNVAFDTNGHVYVSNSFANSGGPENILQSPGRQ